MELRAILRFTRAGLLGITMILLVVIPFLTLSDSHEYQEGQEYQTSICTYTSCGLLGTSDCGCSSDSCTLCYNYNITYKLVRNSQTYFASSSIVYPATPLICMDGVTIFAIETICYFNPDNIQGTLSLSLPLLKSHFISISILSILCCFGITAYIILKLGKLYSSRASYTPIETGSP